MKKERVEEKGKGKEGRERKEGNINIHTQNQLVLRCRILFFSFFPL
jgi:hypothetical protein